jgi:hypothetical protein
MYALKRRQVDTLLLHEAYEEHANIENISWLEEQKSWNRCKEVGFSTGLVFSEALRQKFPSYFVAQAAVPPLWLMQSPSRSSGNLNLHSIAKAGEYLYRSDHEFQTALASASRIFGAFHIDAMTQVLAASFALANATLPGAGLVFSSIDSGRLIAFLKAIRIIDCDIGNKHFLEEIGMCTKAGQISRN